jgi:hypothetical protein
MYSFSFTTLGISYSGWNLDSVVLFFIKARSVLLFFVSQQYILPIPALFSRFNCVVDVTMYKIVFTFHYILVPLRSDQRLNDQIPPWPTHILPNFKVSNAESDQLYEWPFICLTNWLHMTNSLTCPTMTDDQLWQMTNCKWSTASDQLLQISTAMYREI